VEKRDTEDNQLGGWSFSLYFWNTTTSSWDFISSQTTNLAVNDGWVCWENLTPGLYEIRETLKPGWAYLDPDDGELEVTLAAGGLEERTFINRAPEEACLIICKFQDSNVNAIWDHGEPGLPDWSFHVKGPNVDRRVTTGRDEQVNGKEVGYGCVRLDDVIAGESYTITEEMQSGWYSTKPGGDPPYTQTVTVDGNGCARVEFGNREERREIPTQAPSMNDWGIIAMITLFAGMLVWTLRRRQLALPTA